VIEEIYKTKVTDGLIGTFTFNKNGDLSGAKGAAVLFTVYLGTNKLTTLNSGVAPDATLTAAARKEAAG
jgi:hypothetical protein